MSQKNDYTIITDGAFPTETGVLTLEISLGDYSLTGKTITAVFSQTAVETAPLTVSNGLIQLPITLGLLVAGENQIQLNIREGVTLEQSPIMKWKVGLAVVGTDPAPTDVDIIAYLLAKSDSAIQPESYSGTDFQKLQSAFIAAIAQQKALCISKEYDIGESSLVIDMGINVRDPLYVFGGGKILKSVTGNIFSCVDKYAANVYFDSIWFEGAVGATINVFDCLDGHLTRLSLNNCHYSNVNNVIFSSTYVQSFRITGGYAEFITGSIFDIQGALDTHTTGLIVESSSGNFLKHGGTGEYNALYGFSTRDCCLEGFNGTDPVFYIVNASSLNIDGNYFEANEGGTIVFSDVAVLSGINISHNRQTGETSSTRAFVKWGSQLLGCLSESNTISAIPIHDTTQVTSGKVISTNDVTGGLVNSIETDIKYLYRTDLNLVSNNVTKVGTNYYGALISKLVPTMTWVDLCTIVPYIYSGLYITVRGGGLQGNYGVYGLNKTFKVTRSNTDMLITADINDSWGAAEFSGGPQKDNVRLAISGTSLILQANSQSNYASVKYDLFVEIFGNIGSFTID